MISIMKRNYIYEMYSLENSIFVDGGHQLNIVQFNGRYIYATDYKVNKWVWYQTLCLCYEKTGVT